MAVFNTSGGKATSMPVGFFWGGVVSTVVTVLISAVMAWLVISQKIKESQIGYGIMVLLTLASFIGAKVSYGKIKRQRLVVSFGSGLVYFGILLCITALFFGGQYSGVGETGLMILCGSGLAFLSKGTSKSAVKRGKKRKGYC